MQLNIAGFSISSSAALNHFMNKNKKDHRAVSESRGSVSGFENYDIYWSRATKYGSAMIVKKQLNSYAVELFFGEVDICFTPFNTETGDVLVGLTSSPHSNWSSFNFLLECCSHG